MALVRLKERPDAQLYACLALARMCFNKEERMVYRRLGAVAWMIRLSLDPPWTAGNVLEQGVQIAATRALLNLSISPDIQVVRACSRAANIQSYDAFVSRAPTVLNLIQAHSHVCSHYSLRSHYSLCSPTHFAPSLPRSLAPSLR